MKYTFAALALAATAFGASNDTSLIPTTGVSNGCASFLESLNSDSSLQTCLKPLLTATEAFSPTSGSSASASDVDSVLSKVCASSVGCDDATIRTWLTKFASSCSVELNQNKDVLALYDALYVSSPLRGAVCSVDSATQKYCVDVIAAANKANSSVLAAKDPESHSSTWSAWYVAQAAKNLVASTFGKRTFDERATTTNLASIVTPNATTYQDTNLPFLFLQSTMSKANLCTSCTRSVFASYLKFESNQPYNGGISKSPILGGQNELLAAINSTCGASFIANIESEAGVGTTANTSGATSRVAVPAAATIVAGVLAIVFAA